MQSNISVLTNEADLDIKYGMLNLREERELARASFKYIATDVCNIQQSYIQLGFHLCEAKRCGYYEDFGYDKFEDFVAANFGMEKSALSRCMNVYIKFFAKERYTPTVLPGKEPRNEYEQYSYSQLCEMVSLTSEQLKEIKPDMTIKQIRELKKNISKPASVPSGEKDGEGRQVVTLQPEHDLGWFVEQYISMFSKTAAILLKICKKEKNLETCAKVVQKNLAPHGYYRESGFEYGFTFLSITKGIDFCIGQESFHTSYVHFVKELKKLTEKSCNGNDENKQVATSQLDGQKEKKKEKPYDGFNDELFIEDLLDICREFILDTGIIVENTFLSARAFSFTDEGGNFYKIQFSKIEHNETYS